MNAIVAEATGLKRHYSVNRGMFRDAATVKALNGASFSLEAGKTLAVVGESGCGKSTLARLVTMIEEPTDGQLLIDGKPVQAGDPDLRRKVQIVFQNPYGSLNPRQKIGAILEEPLKINTPRRPLPQPVIVVFIACLRRRRSNPRGGGGERHGGIQLYQTVWVTNSVRHEGPLWRPHASGRAPPRSPRQSVRGWRAVC